MTQLCHYIMLCKEKEQLQTDNEQLQADNNMLIKEIKKMQAEIDATFDDEKFAKMDPDAAIDAAYARKEFKGVKPSLIDYMLWSMKFVTKSEYVEIAEK